MRIPRTLLTAILAASPILSVLAQTSGASARPENFMFIYPTVFGPAITFQDRTYGTGFGIDAALSSRLRENPSSVAPLNSYEGKQMLGNLMFYSGWILVPAFGAGVPVMGLSTLVSGAAYSDLSTSIALYNGDLDGKITFDLKYGAGHRLRWNNADYDPHDPGLLGELSTDPQAKPFIERYRSISNAASTIAWSSLGVAGAGIVLGMVLDGTNSGGGGYVGGANFGLLFVGGTGCLIGLGLLTISSLVGTWAESDLVQGVRLYNQNH